MVCRTYRACPVGAPAPRTRPQPGCWAAFAQLPERCQRLLSVLMVDEPPSYEELSAALGMPIGSIGPTRGRCLEKLRALVAAQAGPASAAS